MPLPLAASSPATSLTDARTDRHQRVQALLDQIVSCTDPDRRQDLIGRVVVEHRSVARSVALRYRSRGVELADLEQLACVGMMKAARRWQPGQCADFLQFAVPTMTGEIKRYFRDHGSIIRPTRRIQELRAAMSTVLELVPGAGDADVAARLAVPVEAVHEARRAGDLTHPRSLDAPTGEGQEWSDILGESDQGYEVVEHRMLLAEVLSVLTERERLVVRLRFCDDCSQAEIGRQIGVSQMQVSRILAQISGKVHDRWSSVDSALAG